MNGHCAMRATSRPLVVPGMSRQPGHLGTYPREALAVAEDVWGWAGSVIRRPSHVETDSHKLPGGTGPYGSHSRRRFASLVITWVPTASQITETFSAFGARSRKVILASVWISGRDEDAARLRWCRLFSFPVGPTWRSQLDSKIATKYSPLHTWRDWFASCSLSFYNGPAFGHFKKYSKNR